MTNSSQFNQEWLNPIKLKTNLAFFLIATAFLIFVAWTMKVNLISSFADTPLSLRYSPWNTFIPIKLWMRLAVILSLILPIFCILLEWRSAVRGMFIFYVGILLVQIITESIFYKIGLPGMNFIVGFVYTTYRVWQLWYYSVCLKKQNLLRKSRQKTVEVIFVSGILFWLINWFILAINLVTRI